MALDQTLLAEKYTNEDNLYLYGQRIFSVQTEVADWRNDYDLHDFFVDECPSVEGSRWWVPREVVLQLMSIEDLWNEEPLSEELLSEWTFFYEFY
jgi:hypothetical protein